MEERIEERIADRIERIRHYWVSLSALRYDLTNHSHPSCDKSWAELQDVSCSTISIAIL